MKTKKNANMFSMNALIIPSELRFAQSQYHTMNNDRRNTREKQMMKRFIGGVSSTHFSILACNVPSSILRTPLLMLISVWVGNMTMRHRGMPLGINVGLLDDLAGVWGKDRWDDLTTFKKGLAIFILFDLTVITGVVTYFVIVGII